MSEADRVERLEEELERICGILHQEAERRRAAEAEVERLRDIIGRMGLREKGG